MGRMLRAVAGCQGQGGRGWCLLSICLWASDNTVAKDKTGAVAACLASVCGLARTRMGGGRGSLLCRQTRREGSPPALVRGQASLPGFLSTHAVGCCCA